MYEDYYQMYIVGIDMFIMCVDMEKEGNFVFKWYKDNYLQFNLEKFSIIGIK